MKIDSLSSLSYAQSISQVGNPARGSNQISKPNAASQQQEAQSLASGASSTTGLSNAERAYFAQLFPDSLSQINSHGTYSTAGVNSYVELGQIINRKV
ncbi:MAG: hypothetical protein WAO19_08425 [Candidatus Kryptoniota bacterium]